MPDPTSADFFMTDELADTTNPPIELDVYQDDEGKPRVTMMLKFEC